MNKTICIAEIGINHNGSVEIAKNLMLVAKEAGIDLVKFQKRNIASCYTKKELDKPRDSVWGTTNREQKEGLELKEKDYDIIDQYSKEINMPWFASAWDMPSVEFLKKYDCKFNKIASARLGHLELLIAIAKQRKHTFISTGMSTFSEIIAAVEIFKNHHCPFTLMQCTSTYPSKTEDLNLNIIQMYKNYFNCPVGYSCHSPGIIFPVIAVALGATVIEKHITLNRTFVGSDHAASMEPHGIRKMVEYIRDAETSVGSQIKMVEKDEIAIREKLWRTEDVKS